MSTRQADKAEKERVALLQGTLDLLILRTLVFGPQHGQGIARAIMQQAEDTLLVDHGSLYPALQRLETKGWIERGVGHVRQQPQGPLLHAHQERTQAARRRNAAMAAPRRRHRPHPRAGRGVDAACRLFRSAGFDPKNVDLADALAVRVC